LATISDVAKSAGVSKSTVSNVFSKKRPISKEVTERVLEAARRLNYKPNYWARSLANKTTRIIGLNMPAEKVKFSNFHLSLLNGVLKECYDRGYRLLVNTLSSEFTSQVEYQSSEPVDGDILLDPSADDPRILERIENRLPLVVIGRPPRELESRVSYVNNDNVGMAELVAEYLIRLGHRHILFLNAPKHMTVSEDRETGYRRAYEKAGIPVQSKLIQYMDCNHPSNLFGYKSTKQLLAANPAITAVIADSDKVALGVYQAAEELKLHIPNDISVFAFSHDSIFAPEFIPPLTGVRLNGEMLGSEAAKLLIDSCESKDGVAKRLLIPAELVIRGSCGAARTQYTDHIGGTQKS
jgi:DNA-binding LacI/PurR family transcriptional regulator